MFWFADATHDPAAIQDYLCRRRGYRTLVGGDGNLYDSPVMTPTSASSTVEHGSGARWLLLIHQLPRKPDYFRVKIGRRLERLGAVAIKNSIYVIPYSTHAVEDFQWLLREIADGGGEASICRAEFVDGLTDGEIEQLLRDARAHDYEEIASRARALLRQLPAGRAVSEERRRRLQADLARIRSRLDALSKIDFFDARASSPALSLIQSIEDRLTAPRARESSRATPGLANSDIHGRTWVTREGIFVDRIASAWLIRRFIDPDARFKFVAPEGYRPRDGELRFDMYEAEYTHEGDRCTFETLLRRFRIEDPALADIAEIVHAIDLRDGKFERDDARGIERVLAGIAAAYPDDVQRLERGAALFDDLYVCSRSS